MGGCLGRNIIKRQNVIVFINFIARNLPTQNFSENIIESYVLITLILDFDGDRIQITGK